jgi:hypothetical protein
MPQARSGDLSASMAILGLLVQRSDTASGVGVRLTEMFPRAQWSRTSVHKNIPVLITLAEHLALLMAMRDAESRLSGRGVFRVDSTAVLGSLRGGYPVLAEVKRQISNLLSRRREWSL